MATKPAGIARVILGKKNIIAIVKATSPSIVNIGAPASQCMTPSAPSTLNCSICAKKITIAKPFTKPSITGYGTMRIYLPNFSPPKIICKMPVSTMVANRYSTPCCETSATITTAIEPVAPEIMPGRPPTKDVTIPIKNAPYKPTKGFTPATKANATASGTSAKATVRPERTSSFTLPTCL